MTARKKQIGAHPASLKRLMTQTQTQAGSTTAANKNFFDVLEFQAASSGGVEGRGILSDEAAELTSGTRGLSSACMRDRAYTLASGLAAVKGTHRRRRLLLVSCAEHAHCI
jgi:hypothetical protein